MENIVKKILPNFEYSHLVLFYIKAMEAYSVTCKEILWTKIVRRIKQTRLILFSNCAIWGNKKSKFVKNQEVHWIIVWRKFKTNKIINKFCLIGNKFMPKLKIY